MNPLVWPGEKFLPFYAALALVVLLAVHWRARGASEARVNVTFMTSDPCRIAYLRGGASEAIRVAVFSLVDRGLLAPRPDGSLAVKRKDAPSMVRRKLDQAILAACLGRATPASLLRSRPVRQQAEAYGEDLRRESLLADSRARLEQGVVFVAAIALLGGLAYAKVTHALAEGRDNVLFLILLGLMACALAGRFGFRRLTAAGGAMLADLRTLTRRLLDRAHTFERGGAGQEALLVAGVYGLWALPSSTFPFIDTLYPRPRPDGSGDGGGSSSSDGGDSGGSGCGGGCGGCGSD